MWAVVVVTVRAVLCPCFRVVKHPLIVIFVLGYVTCSMCVVSEPCLL